MPFEQVLRDNAGNSALLIGNGINRYNNDNGHNSWEGLLADVARSCATGMKTAPVGTSITEFYDVLDLKSKAGSSGLQAQFCELMSQWQPVEQHSRITGWAARHRVPILTTNYDALLSRASGSIFQRTTTKRFTDYYPWECFYAPQPLAAPCDGFGIWHVNGMEKYHRSVRLGLSHYMGSVHRARNWMHGGNQRRLFNGRSKPDWLGAHTWLHIFFFKPLIIFGLALAENEVFLRWLLIERAKYFRKFRAREKPAWYIYSHDANDRTEQGKLFFLESIGVRCVKTTSYDQIYACAAWQD